MLEFGPVAVEARQRGKPRPPPTEPLARLAGVRRRAVIGPFARESPEARVSPTPQTDPMSDQIAEGEEQGVEPF
ncbi:MAG: hypothetical protein OER21_13275 [Gemmatimonadota bacterium]|nr:hypothetical protein [Gemmatimonadota bacterium]